MSSRICMNKSCGTKSSVLWKKGWVLKSGEIADLCFNCGSAYESQLYCDTFHSEESGWRECSLCNKRLHCGCSASLPFIEIQDFGGVWCISCAQIAVCNSTMRDGISSESQSARSSCDRSDPLNTQLCGKLQSDNSGHGGLLSLSNIVDSDVGRYMPPPLADFPNGSSGHMKSEPKHSLGTDLGLPSLSQSLNAPPIARTQHSAEPDPLRRPADVYAQPNNDKPNSGNNDIHEPQVPTLSMSLCSPSETSNFSLEFPAAVEEEENIRSNLSLPTQKPRNILPKPPKGSTTKGSEANKSSVSPKRVGRPPAEGRLRSQLLPRYWPRITDQELQKLSGDLNSTIVPLFEKILSASDASKIGRLVLPKACAEAYFPPINQSEGLPLKIQDVRGNEWTFHFRFWPNNNSRMYVLEGVTPCIQSLQLQAGDTVTFSRIDPGGKLVIGYRKASNAVETQDPQLPSANPNGSTSAESFSCDVTNVLAAANGFSVLQPVKDLPDLTNLVNVNIALDKNEKLKGKVNEEKSQQPKMTSDKKRMRNISTKSKRLVMRKEDAVELRLTWGETQDLLRPPSNVRPGVFMVEDFEFEEYNEPPVFGKKTFFTSQLSGGEQQWVQCDKCSKWRKLPADVLLPPKWTCSENIWDSSRSSCPAPEELSSRELDNLFRLKDTKKRRVTKTSDIRQGCEPSGLDALATAATLGEHEEPSAKATTRHPRHRPGCTCIVCSQPPSGKGKHKPSCVCNVCLTVKRRFKTLMMRKKKRQCEREAEIAQQKIQNSQVVGSQVISNPPINKIKFKKLHIENEGSQEKVLSGDSNSNAIDLNCHPIREDIARTRVLGSAMVSLGQAASGPSDTSLRPIELANRQRQKQNGADSCVLQQNIGHNEGSSSKEDCHALIVNGQEKHESADRTSKELT